MMIFRRRITDICVDSSGPCRPRFTARMGAEAARVDALAAREVWKALGVPERMGAVEENVGHCQWHEGFTPALEAYLDRFLLRRTDGPPTDILRSRFTAIDRAKWIPWTTPALK